MSIRRETLADIFALITFGLVVGMAVELLIAGLSVEQSIQSRLMSIPMNMLIARPYGIYRDWIMGLGNAVNSKLGEFVMDILAFLSFQMPVYLILLATTGASLETTHCCLCWSNWCTGVDGQTLRYLYAVMS